VIKNRPRITANTGARYLGVPEDLLLAVVVGTLEVWVASWYGYHVVIFEALYEDAKIDAIVGTDPEGGVVRVAWPLPSPPILERTRGGTW
jgi:hypothetical protein